MCLLHWDKRAQSWPLGLYIYLYMASLLQSMGWQRVVHDWATQHSTLHMLIFIYIIYIECTNDMSFLFEAHKNANIIPYQGKKWHAVVQLSHTWIWMATLPSLEKCTTLPDNHPAFWEKRPLLLLSVSLLIIWLWARSPLLPSGYLVCPPLWVGGLVQIMRFPSHLRDPSAFLAPLFCSP